jgi:hypothetical protein
MVLWGFFCVFTPLRHFVKKILSLLNPDAG